MFLVVCDGRIESLFSVVTENDLGGCKIKCEMIYSMISIYLKFKHYIEL